MATPAQLAANQSNAQLSTGPLTPEGKARSAQNARTHGFISRTLSLSPEDQPAFDQLAAGFQAQFSPQTATEQHYVDQLVFASWQQQRLWAAEMAWLSEAARRWREQHPDRPNLSSGTVEAVIVEENPKQWDRYQRYSRQWERAFDRALAELRRSQQERAAQQRFLALAQARQRAAKPNEPNSAEPNEPSSLPATHYSLPAVTQPFVRETPKVGRNASCPCGSSRKYKHCCLNQAA